MFGAASGFRCKWVGGKMKSSNKSLPLFSWATVSVAALVFTQIAPASASATSVDAQLQSLYQQHMGRAADPGGLAYWKGQIANGLSLADVAKEFAASEEGVAYKASKEKKDKAEGQVRELYLSVLGREPDKDGLEYWTGRLMTDATYAEVQIEFARSAEAEAKKEEAVAAAPKAGGEAEVKAGVVAEASQDPVLEKLRKRNRGTFETLLKNSLASAAVNSCRSARNVASYGDKVPANCKAQEDMQVYTVGEDSSDPDAIALEEKLFPLERAYQACYSKFEVCDTAANSCKLKDGWQAQCAPEHKKIQDATQVAIVAYVLKNKDWSYPNLIRLYGTDLGLGADSVEIYNAALAAGEVDGPAAPKAAVTAVAQSVAAPVSSASNPEVLSAPPPPLPSNLNALAAASSPVGATAVAQQAVTSAQNQVIQQDLQQMPASDTVMQEMLGQPQSSAVVASTAGTTAAIPAMPAPSAALAEQIQLGAKAFAEYNDTLIRLGEQGLISPIASGAGESSRAPASVNAAIDGNEPRYINPYEVGLDVDLVPRENIPPASLAWYDKRKASIEAANMPERDAQSKAYWDWRDDMVVQGVLSPVSGGPTKDLILKGVSSWGTLQAISAGSKKPPSRLYTLKELQSKEIMDQAQKDAAESDRILAERSREAVQKYVNDTLAAFDKRNASK